jgi:hypothetical protein
LVECDEGEQLDLTGLGCEPIITDELQPAPIECGEGEEFVDGQCQLVPIEEDTAAEDESEDEESGGEDEESGGEKNSLFG